MIFGYFLTLIVLIAIGAGCLLTERNNSAWQLIGIVASTFGTVLLVIVSGKHLHPKTTAEVIQCAILMGICVAWVATLVFAMILKVLHLHRLSKDRSVS